VNRVVAKRVPHGLPQLAGGRFFLPPDSMTPSFKIDRQKTKKETFSTKQDKKTIETFGK